MAAPITAPSKPLSNQNHVTAPVNTANASPFRPQTATSLRITRQALVLVSSRVAIARTATVRVWVPALPPIEATIGIRTASATSCWMVPSNTPMTIDAAIAVKRLTSNQVKRDRVVSRIALERSSSSPTPARRIMSSSYSSSITSTTSSTVITPTSRPLSSTTGAEIRSR